MRIRIALVPWLDLFARREVQPVWRTRSEIEANLGTREVPPRP
jgi:hypothetical protein